MDNRASLRGTEPEGLLDRSPELLAIKLTIYLSLCCPPTQQGYFTLAHRHCLSSLVQSHYKSFLTVVYQFVDCSIMCDVLLSVVSSFLPGMHVCGNSLSFFSLLCPLKIQHSNCRCEVILDVRPDDWSGWLPSWSACLPHTYCCKWFACYRNG